MALNAELWGGMVLADPHQRVVMPSRHPLDQARKWDSMLLPKDVRQDLRNILSIHPKIHPEPVS
jgi:hypothetical protein